MAKKIVGGGAKKVLYTLATVKRIGLLKSAKALRTNNACKACGLGMGGQLGGMTNENNEFPSVCNKSIQAQSTDIQEAIPIELFKHSISELKELSAKELEHIGRLANPIYKSAESNHYKIVDWDWALEYSARQFSQSAADRSFFYSSGRSSNESGFVLQLLARLYGTNNINNCSYYCHQATSIGLKNSIGNGTSTVELADLSGCDLVFLIGANPASNHPRFIHQLKALRDRGGEVVVINPAKEPGLVKFAVPKSPSSMITGGSNIASHYLQPKIGSDLALLKGIGKAIIEQQGHNQEFIDRYCDNFDAFKADITSLSWPDITDQTGLTQEAIDLAAKYYIDSKNTVFAWGMGITHHQNGVENVEYIANLALLRGMVGKPFAGLLPLRGHSNVQGIGTVGVKPILSHEIISNIENTLSISLPTTEGYDTLAGLTAAMEGRIDNACIVGGNLYSATPNSQWSANALNRIGYKMFLTTTLNQGHLYGAEDSEVLILPVTARDEEPQATTQESMFNYVRLSDGGIERLNNVRSEVAILAELGKRLIDKKLFDFNHFTQHQSIRETIAATVPGMEALKDIGIAKKEFHVNGRLLHQPSFKTTNKRAHFNIRRLPRKKTSDNFPFLLASIRSEGQFNSIIYQENDNYRHNASRDSLLICTEDIHALGLTIGEHVTVRSKTNELILRIVPFDLPSGNVMAYYPEANILTEHTIDPRSKTPNFKSVPVAITPC